MNLACREVTDTHTQTHPYTTHIHTNNSYTHTHTHSYKQVHTHTHTHTQPSKKKKLNLACLKEGHPRSIEEMFLLHVEMCSHKHTHSETTRLHVSGVP